MQGWVDLVRGGILVIAHRSINQAQHTVITDVMIDATATPYRQLVAVD